jgi:threonine/homoserine/homoserine lactone efflux protein
MSDTLLAFSLVALGMSLAPGPNMVYLLSRSVSQGAGAGFVSLGGVALAFVTYLTMVALGLSALLFAVPVAYDVLRAVGAMYFLYLAWGAVKPNGASPFDVRPMQARGNRQLFVMGFATNLFNPKTALLYMSLLPQFVRVEDGHVLQQFLLLGVVQLSVSMTVNGSMILAAGRMAAFFARNAFWIKVQRYVMGTVFAALACHIALKR